MTAVAHSTRAELLRLRGWPAVWVTLAAWVSLALLFGYVFDYVAYRTGDVSFSNEGRSAGTLLASLLPARVPDVLLQGMPLFGGALMLVLGAIVAGSGYGWGTWKTVLTQGPSRAATVAGSMLALTVVVVGTVLLTLALFLAVSLTIALAEGEAVVAPSAGPVVESVLAGCLVLELWALAGYAVGTLARGPALAVGLGLVWVLVVEPLLRGVGSLLGPVEALTRGLPGTAAGSLVGSIIGTGGPDPTPGVLDVLAGERAAVSAGAWVVALALFSIALVRRRDVT